MHQLNHLDTITTEIARKGVARSGAELAELARLANRRQIGLAIVSLLTDPTAPDVVRERAAARIATQLTALPPELPTIAA